MWETKYLQTNKLARHFGENDKPKKTHKFDVSLTNNNCALPVGFKAKWETRNYTALHIFFKVKIIF